MTELEQVESTVDAVSRTPHGRREMAAARALGRASRVLRSAFMHSGLSQRALADALGVTPGRVSQVLSGESDLYVSTLSRYLCEMGYELQIEARALDGTLLETPRRGSRRSRRHSTVLTGSLTGVGKSPIIVFASDEIEGSWEGYLSLNRVGLVPVADLGVAIAGVTAENAGASAASHGNPGGYRKVEIDPSLGGSR